MSNWTAVRVSRETKEKLQELRELWIDLAHRIKEPLGDDEVRSGRPSTRDEFGLDQVIRRLIILWEKHRDRS
jgi:hypothetical protein